MRKIYSKKKSPGLSFHFIFIRIDISSSIDFSRKHIFAMEFLSKLDEEKTKEGALQKKNLDLRQYRALPNQARALQNHKDSLCNKSKTGEYASTAFVSKKLNTNQTSKN